MPWTTERKNTHTYGTEKLPSDCLGVSKIEFCTKETCQILNSSQTNVLSFGNYSDSGKLEELFCLWAISARISTPFSPIDNTYPDWNSCTLIAFSEGYMQPFLPITVFYIGLGQPAFPWANGFYVGTSFKTKPATQKEVCWVAYINSSQPLRPERSAHILCTLELESRQHLLRESLSQPSCSLG